MTQFQFSRLMPTFRLAAGLALVLGLALPPARPAAAAIALAQSIGTAQSKTLGTSLTITVPGAGVAAGSRVIVAFASDVSNGAVSAADSRGNVYGVDADMRNKNAVRTLILSAYVSTTLTSGNVITITHPLAAARAASATAFSGLDPVRALDRTKTAAGGGTAPSTGAALPTTEYNELLIGVVGVETGNGTAFTPGINYTALAGLGTTGGNDKTNISVRPEYRIVSTTGAYAATGSLGAGRSWAAALATYRMAPPTVQLNTASLNAAEGGGTAVLTATLSAQTTASVSVSYATADGTAAAGADYQAASGLLTFTPGSLSQLLSIPILDDTLDESSETFSLSLSGPGNASLGSPSSATVTVVDNDPVLVQFSASSYGAVESAGSALITATIDSISGLPITVNYSALAGTALAGSDFTAVSGVLTFTPGITQTTFPVPLLDDPSDEPAETVLLSLSAPQNAQLGARSTATLTLADDDNPPTVGFGQPLYRVLESEPSAPIAVSLSNPSAFTITVNYATSNGTAQAGSDYTAASGTLTFAPGSTSIAFSVPITDDTTDELDETVNLSLSAPVSATLGSAASVLYITDNDGAPTVFFASLTYTATEGSGSAAIGVALSNPTAVDVTVAYTTSAGSAQAGTDYTNVTGVVTITAGNTQASFSVPLLDDALDEDDETVNLGLSNPTNAPLGVPALTQLSIVDDDPLPSVQVGGASFSGSETPAGGSILVPVSVSPVSGRSVTVRYATSSGTALAGSDFTAVSGVLTFTAGTTTLTVTVPLLADTLDESSESLSLSLSAPANASLGAPATAGLTITDDDPPPTVQLSPASVVADEFQPLLVFTASLSTPSGLTVTVQYATADGTAQAGTDYVAASGVLTFAPGTTAATINLLPTDDALDELDETLALALSAPVNATLGAASAQITLLDDDEPPSVEFDSTTYSVTETGGQAVLSATLSTPSGLTITVSYASNNGTAVAGADYLAASGVLTFAPGDTLKTLGVTVLDDILVEATEGLTVTLLTANNATLDPLNATTAADVIIVDNDTNPATMVSLDRSAYSVKESAGLVVITATLDAASPLTVTVVYSTSSGTALAGTDFVAASGLLTFTPGVTLRTTSVVIVDDTLVEADETLQVSLLAPVNASLGTLSAADVIIVNDEVFWLYAPFIARR